MGAIRHNVRSHRQGHIIVAGSFGTNGTSSPASTGIKGQGFTVARTGTGVFTVTLSDKYADADAITVTAHGTAIEDFQVGAYNSSAGTFTITTLVSGSAADVASGAANRLSFTCHMKGPLC